MLHAEGSHQTCVRFYDNTVLLAKVADFFPNVEWMQFDLVDYRHDPWLTFDKFLELDSVVADAVSPAFSNGILYRSPRLKHGCLVTVWRVEQEQVDVIRIACLQRLIDRLSCSIMVRAGC